MKTVSWSSGRLKINEGMRHDEGDFSLVVDHVDRRVDPYMATVIHGTIIIYTGLHSTLADARQTCLRKMKDAS